MEHEDILEKYLKDAKIIGSLNLLCANDALKYIDDCANDGCSIAGVEGFILLNSGAIQPAQEASTDIADFRVPQERFVEYTKAQIQRFPTYWFEVVHERMQGG